MHAERLAAAESRPTLLTDARFLWEQGVLVSKKGISQPEATVADRADVVELLISGRV